MKLIAHMVMMYPGLNFTCSESRRFADMCLKVNQVRVETVTDKGLKYLYEEGGWVERGRHLANRGARSNRTEVQDDVPLDLCYGEFG